MQFKHFKNFREYDRKIFEITNLSNNQKESLKERLCFGPVYGIIYIDRQCGVTLRIIGDKKTALEDTTVWLIRAGAFEDMDFKLAENPKKYQKNILKHIQEVYYNPNDIELLNDITIDNFRHPIYPNDVQVQLPTEEGVEQMWVRLTLKTNQENLYIGELLNTSDVLDEYKSGANVAIEHYHDENEKVNVLFIKCLVELVD